MWVKAHFTQGVKAKVEPKWSNPIGAATEICPKGFTIRVKTKLRYDILIHDRLALWWAQGPKRLPINLGCHFPTLGTNVVTIKYYLFFEIYTPSSCLFNFCPIFTFPLFVAVSYDNKRVAPKKKKESTPNIEDWSATSWPQQLCNNSWN
jgi:hypothetical protein